MRKQLLDFSKDYVLKDDRVRISPLLPEHANSLARISENPEIWTYFLEKGQGLERLNPYIQSAVQKRRSKEEYPFVVFDKQSGTYAGITRLYAYDPDLRIIKMGHTWYGKVFWGTGLNKHCKYLLFRFCFDTLDLMRIGFGVHAENLRSVHALKKIGVQQEGTLRSFLNNIAETGRTDLLLFSILQEEWNAKVKSEFERSLRLAV